MNDDVITLVINRILEDRNLICNGLITRTIRKWEVQCLEEFKTELHTCKTYDYCVSARSALGYGYKEPAITLLETIKSFDEIELTAGLL